MKFVILTDIHLGPESYRKGILGKINANAKLFLSDFVKKINKTIKPQFVVVLGDLIQDDNLENDRKNINYVVRTFKKIKYPVYCAAGNHDLINISEINLAKIFKLDKLYYSFDQNNIHFIVLFSKAFDEEKVEISEKQIAWLKKDLKKSEKKCIVLVHHSLASQDLKGNPWFEGNFKESLIRNRRRIRTILEKSQKVEAVFNGHLHWNKKYIHNSIPYFTIQSLTENEADKGIASEAYAIVDITDDKITVETKGNYPKNSRPEYPAKKIIRTM